jgi:hypothetical protein
MGIVDVYKTNKDQFKDKRISQIIAFCGDGQLLDGGSAPLELREFLLGLSLENLVDYLNQCLDEPFKDSGLALQDIINEVGRRIGYTVENGRYRGVRNENGFDGLWESPGKKIIVEVKTTDAYRIDLTRVGAYRKKLANDRNFNEEDLSILIVVGRIDTGDLEAQVRGSKFAWDIRIISADALMKMAKVKSELEDPVVIQKIHGILVPKETTKLDEIVDLLFVTAEDSKSAEQEDEEPASDEADDGQIVVDKFVVRESKKDKKFTPLNFNEQCKDRISEKLGIDFIQDSRGKYYNPTEDMGLVCSISREYVQPKANRYWFLFYPYQLEYLEKYQKAFLALGCGSEKNILLLPKEFMKGLLEKLNKKIRNKDGSTQYHVHVEEKNGTWSLIPNSKFDRLNLNQYCIK